jgi:hypothetical protein
MNLDADLAQFTKANPTPKAGKYTLILPGGDDPAAVPSGDGFGTVSITAAGAITFAGTLADGTKVSQKSSLSKDGLWPFYAALYSGKGSILGWITNLIDGQLDGSTHWNKPASAKAKHYSAGFTVTNDATGSRYQAPTNLTDFIVGFTNGMVIFFDGNLAAPFTNMVMVTSGNKIVNLSGNKLTMTLTTSSGLVKGSVTPPGATRAVSFQGAVHKAEKYGAGFFLGTNQSGGMLFGPIE